MELYVMTTGMTWQQLLYVMVRRRIFVHDQFMLMLMFYVGTGLSVKGRDSVFGPGNTSMILDDIVCQGTETHLLLCQHRPVFQHNCNHMEAAAVICGGTCKNFAC